LLSYFLLRRLVGENSDSLLNYRYRLGAISRVDSPRRLKTNWWLGWGGGGRGGSGGWIGEMHNCGIERSRGSVTPIFSPILIGTREQGARRVCASGVCSPRKFALSHSVASSYLPHPRVPVGFLTFPLFVVRSILALCRASQHGRAILVRRFFHAIPVDVVQSNRIDSTDPVALSP